MSEHYRECNTLDGIHQYIEENCCGGYNCIYCGLNKDYDKQSLIYKDD